MSFAGPWIASQPYTITRQNCLPLFGGGSVTIDQNFGGVMPYNDSGLRMCALAHALNFEGHTYGLDSGSCPPLDTTPTNVITGSDVSTQYTFVGYSTGGYVGFFELAGSYGVDVHVGGFEKDLRTFLTTPGTFGSYGTGNWPYYINPGVDVQFQSDRATVSGPVKFEIGHENSQPLFYHPIDIAYKAYPWGGSSLLFPGFGQGLQSIVEGWPTVMSESIDTGGGNSPGVSTYVVPEPMPGEERWDFIGWPNNLGAVDPGLLDFSITARPSYSNNATNRRMFITFTVQPPPYRILYQWPPDNAGLNDGFILSSKAKFDGSHGVYFR